MAREVVFLTLGLLHLGQATTCQGDNCPTGLVITGGTGAGTGTETETPTGTETFPAETLPTTCTIPPFPAPGRTFHTLSVVENGRQLVACGGAGGGDTASLGTCISWRSGQQEWTHYADLSQPRMSHAAVTINKRIIILGGRASMKTGEVVGDGGSLLTLQNSGFATCALAWGDGFLTIGGSAGGLNVHGKVDRYDSEGNYLDSLPDLAKQRWQHACTTFFTNSEQVLLVAGGLRGRGPIESTEIYSNGVWRTGANLPRGLLGLKAAHLNQQVVITGGLDEGHNYSGEVVQYNVETDTWTQMTEKMKVPRRDHAVVEANLALLCTAGESTPSASTSATSRATTTTGLDPLLALLICLVLVCCRRCTNVSSFKQSL